MGAVTYPNAAVQEEINRYFVPVQYNVVDEPDVMDRFNAPWTPTIIIQDPEGREHRRSQGYLDPSRFLAEMALARLKDAVDRRDYATASQRLDETLERTKGDPDREPEALYWAAVIRYKATEDPSNLPNGWNVLFERFPNSEWARKAEFIRMS